MTNSSADILAKLQEDAAHLGVDLSAARLDEINAFWQLLFDYNSHTNLVARADIATVMSDHVLDSLTLVKPILDLQAKSRSSPLKLIDIGAGAGFPGLILAISLPELQLTLVEPIGKKARFLQSVVDCVEGLAERVEVKMDRAEDLARTDLRGGFDFATARAVGPLAMTVELALPFLRVGGSFLAQKTVRQLDEDMKAGLDQISKLGGTHKETIFIDSSILRKEHAVLVIEKAKETPDTYPRTWSAIKRENQR